MMCDWCGHRIQDRHPKVQVICYHPDLEDEGVEHLAYYHRDCWGELRESAEDITSRDS